MSVSAAPTRAAERHVSLYKDLSKAVRERGLLRPRYVYYWSRIALALLAVGAIWAGVVLLGNSWFVLILAGALGVVLTQFGFLGHDSAHRQIFRSPRWNDWMSRVFAGVFAGMSYGWWRAKHNRHHLAPNQEGRDPDIAPGIVAFTPGALTGRRSRLTRWLGERQGWFFIPLLTLEGFNLQVDSLRLLLRRRSMPHQRVEAALVLSRLVVYVVLLLLLLPLGKAGAFFGVQMALFGLCLGGAFAPNHIGMPIVPKTMKLDFLSRQVLMSRNVRGGPFVNFALGGLGYQIEHHLFPSMPRPNLKYAQPLVRAYCADNGITYTEVGLLSSYRSVLGYLNNVGQYRQDPFVCPLASRYRD